MTVSVNNIEISVEPGDDQRNSAAARELLRQRAVAVGILDAGSTDEEAIERGDRGFAGAGGRHTFADRRGMPPLLRKSSEEFESGDLVHARHILFQVTPSVRVPEMRARAEQTLNDLLREPDRFDAVAREISNCPSGQHGGNLGQIGRGDTVPEFEKAIFRLGPTGLLREFVKTRHGFHIVAIDQSIPGKRLPFDVVRDEIAERLRARVEEKAP